MKQIILDNGSRVSVYFRGARLTPDAAPMVLLHGFCEDASLWDGLTQRLADLPVIAIDLPGFGQSDLPDAPDMASYADTVLAVLDQLAVARSVVVGHSLGGYVALALAQRYGHRLAGVGLFHSHPFPDTEERKTARTRGMEMVLSGKRDLYVAQLFPNLFTPDFAHKHPHVIAALIERGKEQSPEGIAAALQAMKSRHDQQETLRDIQCPALFLLGSEDNLVPIAQGWQAALLPQVASVEVLPDVAHMGMFEAPAQSAAALRAFFDMAAQST
jgi:pimeloyl-ACP methyl ester carboxylesterase